MNPLTFTKFPLWALVKVMQSVWVPLGAGDAVTAGVVIQFCQPPASVTGTAAVHEVSQALGQDLIYDVI